MILLVIQLSISDSIFRHFKASSVKFNIVLNLVCCCLCVEGLIEITIGYLGKKEYYTDIIPSLCEVSIVTKPIYNIYRMHYYLLSGKIIR